MATRLEIAEKKLARLQVEYDNTVNSSPAKQAGLVFGQPLDMSRSTDRALINKQNRWVEISHKKYVELQEQIARVEKLRSQIEFKERGLTKNGMGLRLTVDNLPNIKKAISEYDAGKHTVTRVTYRKWVKKVEEFEEFKSNQHDTSELAQRLIDNGDVKQWLKKPQFYFVNGLRKVALELQTDGTFKVSKRYWPHAVEDKQVVADLLEIDVNELV